MTFWGLLNAIYGIFLALFFVNLSCADQKVYENSVASREPNAHLNLEIPYIAHNSITINSNPFSGTNDTLFVTYIGDFSSSGPHAIPNLQFPSSLVSHSILLDRTIGQLQSVWIENKGYDSLLLSSWQIRIREQIYELKVDKTWLESWDAQLAEDVGDGFSPDADIKLPSSPTLLFPVTSSLVYYTDVGVFTDN